MDKVVGIGEYVVSNDQNDIIKTFALATCVALIIYSPAQKVLGMVHIALPSSSIDRQKGFDKPGYFADTAVPFLLNKLCSDFGCNRNELVVKLFGGASSPGQGDVFNIGLRNIKVIEEILRYYHIPYDNSDTGGYISRTIEAEVATGIVKMNIQPMAEIIKGNRNDR